MQKIRIGNDIRLSISLVDKTEYSASNIKNIKCYLVNKTLTESMNKKCCKSQYLLNWCGCPTYHVLPHCKINSTTTEETLIVNAKWTNIDVWIKQNILWSPNWM